VCYNLESNPLGRDVQSPVIIAKTILDADVQEFVRAKNARDILEICHVKAGGKGFSHASVFIIYVDISKLGLPFRRKAPSTRTIMQPPAKRKAAKNQSRTTLILLQNLRERRLGSSLRLAGIQSLRANLLLGVTRSVWVESEKNLLVLQRVLLLDASTLGS
jgi:hypothetical protein